MASLHSLHHRHGASVSIVDATETQSSLGAPLQGADDLTRKCPQDFGTKVPVVAEQGPQPPRQRADPVTNRYRGQNLLLQMHRDIGHATRRATATKTSTPLTTQGYQMTVATPTAFAVQTASFEAATPQEVLDLAHHELGQAARLFGLLAEG